MQIFPIPRLDDETNRMPVSEGVSAAVAERDGPFRDDSRRPK